MIFVTLGTNDKPFTRLLEAIDRAVENGIIKDEILVQSGYTRYNSDHMTIVSSMDQQEFNAAIAKADLIIAHGGAGTVMTALKMKKTVLAAARLAQYHEHVNDHQIQLLESFAKQGYLIYMEDLNDLAPYLKAAETFEPASYVSNTANLIGFLEDWIDHN